MSDVTGKVAAKKIIVIAPYSSERGYRGGTDEADHVYQNIIRAAVKKAFGNRAEPLREMDKGTSGPIDIGIVRDLYHADICIADLTGLNPNVLFELGIRWTLRKCTTVLMHQEPTKLPFDFSRFRSVTYNSEFSKMSRGADGPQELIATRDLAKALTQSALDSSRKDGLVYEAMPGLHVTELPNSHQNVMPWDEFHERCRKWMNDFLSHNLRNHLYEPTVVIGITNGGLIPAEMIVRKFFRKQAVPFLSLWADRSSAGNYFLNTHNEKVADGLLERCGKKTCEILLVDDNLYSAKTSLNAIHFLASRLPTAKIAFLPLFTKQPSHLSLVDQYLIWNRAEFKSFQSKARDLLNTERDDFPYDKSLTGTY